MDKSMNESKKTWAGNGYLVVYDCENDKPMGCRLIGRTQAFEACDTGSSPVVPIRYYQQGFSLEGVWNN
jgi:hypothetical protein